MASYENWFGVVRPYGGRYATRYISMKIQVATIRGFFCMRVCLTLCVLSLAAVWSCQANDDATRPVADSSVNLSPIVKAASNGAAPDTAALILDQCSYLSAEEQAYCLEQLEKIAGSVRQSMGMEAPVVEQLRAVSKLLFGEGGFTLAHTNLWGQPTSLDTVHLDRVFQGREGGTAELALIYWLVCDRLGVEAQVVRRPYELFVWAGDGQEAFYVDLEYSGKVYAERDLGKARTVLVGQSISLQPSDLEPLTAQQVVAYLRKDAAAYRCRNPKTRYTGLLVLGTLLQEWPQFVEVRELLDYVQLTTKEMRAGEYFKLGREFFEAHQWKKAAATLEKVVALEPKHAHAWTLLSACYENMGLPEKAAAALASFQRVVLGHGGEMRFVPEPADAKE